MYASSEYPADLKCQTLSFLRMQWPDGFVGENQFRNWVTKEADHPVHIVLVERGILISHTNVVWKPLEHEGVTFKTYGLTGVFTYPAFRGKGYGSRIVRAGTAYIDQSDADIAMFHCDLELQAFYVRSDWTLMPEATTFIGSREAPEEVADVLMMRFISEKGRAARATFERGTVYFGSDSTW